MGSKDTYLFFKRKHLAGNLQQPHFGGSRHFREIYGWALGGGFTTHHCGEDLGGGGVVFFFWYFFLVRIRWLDLLIVLDLVCFDVFLVGLRVMKGNHFDVFVARRRAFGLFFLGKLMMRKLQQKREDRGGS